MSAFTIYTATYYSEATIIATGETIYNVQPASGSNPFFGASTYTEQAGADNNITPNETLTADYVLPLGTDAVYLGTISYQSPIDGVTREFFVIDDALDSSVLLGTYTPNLAHGHFPTSFLPADIQATSFTPCFLTGTLIETPQGTVNVEELTVGDAVCTQSGTVVEVLWVGQRTVGTFFAGPHMQPVRIRAGALGEGLPLADLTVTADHGMVIDSYVINASALVNGDTIDFVPMDELEDSFTVYHIETENHDVILANGAPAETFVDAVARSHFDNYQEYLDLYGAERIISEMALPRISSRRLLPQVIADRLGMVGTIGEAIKSQAQQEAAHY